MILSLKKGKIILKSFLEQQDLFAFGSFASLLSVLWLKTRKTTKTTSASSALFDFVVNKKFK
jgi:hypothetical protein